MTPSGVGRARGELGSTDRLVGRGAVGRAGRRHARRVSRAIAAAYRFDDPRDPLAVALQERLAAGKASTLCLPQSAASNRTSR